MIESPLQLALALMNAGRFSQAEPILRRALTRAPKDTALLRTLAALLSHTARAPQAVYVLRQCVALTPADGHVLAELAQALAEGGSTKDLSEALTLADRAVALAPTSARAHLALAASLEAAGAYLRAESAYRAAVTLDPSHEMAGAKLVQLLHRTGRPELALEAAAHLARHSAHFHHATSLANISSYASSITPAARFSLHTAAASAVARVPAPPLSPLSALAPSIDRNPDRSLRVAFLSPDFVDHSVTFFLEPLLTALNRTQIEPIALFSSTGGDAVTTRLRTRFAAWHDVPEPSEAAVATLLRRERIDIAIDLAGHTAGSLLLTLRQRLCPVQISCLGYPHSTGLPSIDARLVDSSTDPTGAASLATERLIRLDPCFLCYQPPLDHSPAVAALPVAAGTPFTFGSFNMLGKLSEATKDLWARVLLGAPGSRLILKDSVLAVADARELVLSAFASRGVEPARLTLLARTPSRADHLALYNQVDLALDPTPYCGTTTTCEALLMGVPVLTLTGDCHAARVGVSLLRAVGLDSFIAATPGDYIRRAAELAASPGPLAALRPLLRNQLLASPLCDAPAHARRFEAALRALWQEWCSSYA